LVLKALKARKERRALKGLSGRKVQQGRKATLERPVHKVR
jgi:hypothetical protein